MLLAGGMSTDPGVPTIRNATTVNWVDNSMQSGFQDGVGADATFRLSLILEGYWTAAFNQAGKTPPVHTNSAISGQTSTDIVTGIAAQVRTPAKNVLIIPGFVNDVGSAISDATTQSNLRTILREQLRVKPGSAIFIIGHLWLNGEKWPRGANANDAALVAKNAAIRAVCLEAEFSKWTTYIDARTPLETLGPILNTANAANGVLTQSGGTHLSKPLGLTRWADIVYPLIPLSFA